MVYSCTEDPVGLVDWIIEARLWIQLGILCLVAPLAVMYGIYIFIVKSKLKKPMFVKSAYTVIVLNMFTLQIMFQYYLFQCKDA